MIEDVMDKYIKESDIVEAVNSVGRMDVYETVSAILSGSEEYKRKVMSLLDEEKKKEVEKLLDGGMI